ncbi:hypothetical protein PTRG_10422 [Pyrenophora tritici-repentis Pt-1C-BFP]|uniref:Uncharacterized protein n=1 Tax=Pyrenophora tritici-repentis (strain Pt-1C-BFP) TaxID=426418 RepID=B2WJS5_PYRTR|nr:uncharacterized protein PTRG_10422 [Pyrenophora tritici-repentis Pt-1C-BFP]EDU43472.1 hypothetical protein PTRG_10422 [Pyrenophora tritici-repentis Pt-1C-BFP]
MIRLLAHTYLQIETLPAGFVEIQAHPSDRSVLKIMTFMVKQPAWRDTQRPMVGYDGYHVIHGPWSYLTAGISPRAQQILNALKALKNTAFTSHSPGLTFLIATKLAPSS